MISVLLSTLNGAETLPSVLNSLTLADLPDEQWELVIVDNASTDQTQTVLSKYKESLPLTVISELRAGKNIALNTGLQVLRGDLVIFTDDDVVLPRNFLTGYSCIAHQATDFSIFGGHIEALWEIEPPANLLEEIPLNIAYSLTELERNRGEILAGRLYGPNFAVRRAVFESNILFDERIGPNGGHYIMGDETDFLQRAAKAGHQAFFEPDIVVKHRVAARQLEQPWLAQRAELAGRTTLHQSLRAGDCLEEVATILGIPRWSIKRYAGHQMELALALLHLGHYKKHTARWNRNYILGYAREFKRLSSNDQLRKDTSVKLK